MTIFLLKLSLCWVFFALFYALLLRQETFFRANRFYLLGTAVLGILLAAWPAEKIPVPETGLKVVSLPEFTVGIQQMEAATSSWQSLGFLWTVYGIGAALMAIRMFWGLFKILQMAIKGHSKQLQDGCLLIESTEAKVPFSFFKWVFVPADSMDSVPAETTAFSFAADCRLPPANRSPSTALMLAHERAHAHGWHSADVLFAEILCILFWFHPLAHWYRKALRTVHEYLADAAVSRQADQKQYGLLLIGQSQSGMQIAFANHFFQSPLKQRLIMLTKKASAPIRAIKFGLVAPIALLFAMLFRQAPAIAQVVDQKHLEFVHQLELDNWNLMDTVITFDPQTYKESVKIVTNNVGPVVDEKGKLVYTYTEVKAQYPGGEEAMFKYLVDNVKYPELAQKNGVKGTVVVYFVVDENGNVLRPFGQIDMPNDSKRPLIEEAVRVIQAMPKWVPAKHKGKAVPCAMTLPVKFSLSGPAEKKSIQVDPEFPGGMQELFNFLSKEVKYPEAARKDGAEGMVVVTFMVEPDGSLSTFEVAKSVREDLDNEVIRVLQLSPKWKPGLKDGKIVRVQYTLPFKFKLSSDK